MAAVLTILRDITATSTNAVLYELMVAARTDEKLRATLQHVLEQYRAKILDTARALPGADEIPREMFPVMVAVLTNTFDGAALMRTVLPQPDIEEQRIPLLMRSAERNWRRLQPSSCKLAQRVVQRAVERKNFVETHQGQRPVGGRAVGDHGEAVASGQHSLWDAIKTLIPADARKSTLDRSMINAGRVLGQRGLDRLGQPWSAEHVNASAHRYHHKTIDPRLFDCEVAVAWLWMKTR